MRVFLREKNPVCMQIAVVELPNSLHVSQPNKSSLQFLVFKCVCGGVGMGVCVCHEHEISHRCQKRTMDVGYTRHGVT